jgi:hypothetical protein
MNADKFWWERYPITKEPREWTHLRVKAAERAVRREADKMALFPELRRVRSVEERMEQMDARSDLITRRLRAGRAAMWREARAFLRALPAADRERLLAKWNTRFMPGGPAQLLSVARMMGIEPMGSGAPDPYRGGQGLRKTRRSMGAKR